MSALKLMLLPLFLHVALIMYVGMRTNRARVHAVRSGRTKLSDIATNSGAWPDSVSKLGNNFDNQFDVPMLWYAAMALVVALGLQGFGFVILSWLFLLTRVLHTAIHTGDNNVVLRMYAYLAGVLVIAAMWIWFAVQFFGSAA